MNHYQFYLIYFAMLMISIKTGVLMGSETSAMSVDEAIIFTFCLITSAMFFWQWYRRLSLMWPPDRNALAKFVFRALPAAAFVIVFFPLIDWASFDVVVSFTFVIFYILMGYMFIHLGLSFMGLLFDISWADDAINNGNKAAVPAVAGGFIALAVIYSGSNVGDGPGWWCVVFACGLGFAAWFLLGVIFHKITGVFERVTIERDIGCGIRLGCYFIASGIILARASAGDWTSFGMTVVEFMDGWIVLPLAALMAAAELLVYKPKAKTDDSRGIAHLPSSIICGAAFIVIAILCVMYVIGPLPKNPVYGVAAVL